jgi:hypothetical protein
VCLRTLLDKHLDVAVTFIWRFIVTSVHTDTFATLPDATKRYVVRVSSSALAIKLRNFYVVGILHIMPKLPKIVNTLTFEVKRLSAFTVLPLWTAWRLQRQLANDSCTVAPMLVHTHEYVFMGE